MGGDDGLLSLEENLRGLLEEETLKEASVRHLFRLFDEQIWKLNESAYVSCESEEEQKAVLALLKTHKEERKRLKDSFREAQIREGERKSRARQNLLGRDEGKTDNQDSQKGLRAERANVQKKTESLQSMIRLLRREMNQGASAFDRLEQSSKQLNETVDDQATLQDTLKSTSALLGKLKNKEFREKAYLCFSIIFFFFVVSLVWKQRVLG